MGVSRDRARSLGVGGSRGGEFFSRETTLSAGVWCGMGSV